MEIVDINTKLIFFRFARQQLIRHMFTNLQGSKFQLYDNIILT